MLSFGSTMPLWERTFLWIIILTSAVGGLTSTAFALKNILDPSTFDESCLSNFLLQGKTI